MGKAIGMVEYKTVSSGVTAADAMVKTAQVEIIEEIYCGDKRRSKCGEGGHRHCKDELRPAFDRQLCPGESP